MARKNPSASSISTTSDSLTVAENSGPTAIGILAPTDTSYPSSKLVITVTELPSDGTVLLSNGVTPVSVGETLTVAQLTGLMFKPTAGTLGQTSTFSYKVSDPAGLSATGTATLAIVAGTTPPATKTATLTVAENAPAMAIGIAAPTDPNYAAAQLGVTVTGLPSDGTVLQSDGVTAVTAGETLSVAQLTGLMFKPTAGVFGQSSTFSYKVNDPAGLSATGTATLAIGPDTTPPAAIAATLTVAGNAVATAIGIVAPTDPNYSASQLSITVTSLPGNGVVLLSDGVTQVGLGTLLTAAQLTALLFQPTAGLFGQSSTFSYKVTDPSGLSATGTATLAIGADTAPPVTTDPTLTVAANSGVTAIGIPAPTDSNFSAAQLTATATGLPSDGSILLTDGVTAVTAGETLTVAQLTGLRFKPTAGVSGQSSTFTYTVTDPAGLSATGIENLVVAAAANGISPDGSTLTAGSGGSLLTSAGTWTFSTTATPYGYVILLNGQQAANGSAIELEVANQGTLYQVNNQGTFYEWINSSWVQTTNPIPTTPSPTTNPTTTQSPDGSTLMAGSGGSLVTSAGTWTFSTTATPYGYVILLNGQQAANGSAIELEVANQGNLYQVNNQGTCYEWVNSGWVQTTNPAPTTPSPTTTQSPDGSTLMAGSGGSLVTSAGTWTLGTEPLAPNNVYGYTILLNGQQAGKGQAVELEVTNGGNLYSLSGGGLWWEWVNGNWTALSSGVQPPLPIATATTSLGVVGNSGATPIGIAAPTDPSYSASQLSVTVTALPTDGTVFLSDGATPVTAGETLSVAQLTGLEFRPTANLFNQNSALTYTVSDPAGMTAQGNAWLSVGGNPSAIWHDPPSGATAAAGVDIAPTVVQPSQAGDIVGVQLQNSGATTEAAGYVTFGMVFLDAAVNAGTSLVARINGVDYAVQMDVKSTYADGSVEQAILTLDAPSIAAGGTLDLMLARGTGAAPSPAAPSGSALLANGYNVNVNFTFNNPDGTTTTDSASAAAALQAALAGGTVSQWLAGPGVNEYDVQTTVDGGKLKVEFDIRAYADGTTTTDVIFDNSWMFSPGKTDLNYNVSISQGGTQLYSASNVQQYLYSMWDHQVASAGTISPNVQYDVPYLESTGAIQAYDTSYGVSDAAIQTNYGGLNASNTGPMGTAGVDTYMPGTGGRQDIGPQPNWTAQWLLSQNSTAYQVMMADANASGSIPWHYTDENTGEPINVQTYPNFMIGQTSAGYLQPANGWPQIGNGGSVSADGDPWSPDPAHMPDLNYLSSLVTGSHYQLQLLQAEADYAIADWSGDLLNVSNQPRGLAWELRTIAEAAWLSPNDDPMKSYFTSELDTVMTSLVQTYIAGNVNAPFGQLNGFVNGSYGSYTPTANQTAPWEDGFVVTSLAEIAGMNVPQASNEAVQLMQYMNNYVAGLFTNGPNGFNPLDGTAYKINMNDPSTGSPYTSWSQLFNGSIVAAWQQGAAGVATNPTSIINFNTQTMGGYAEIARAALADEITYTQSPQAIQAYGLVASQIAYAFSLGGGTVSDGSGPTETAAYQNFPQFSIMPRLPDGTYLNASQMQIDTSNAPVVNLTGAAGQDVLLAVVGGGTATLTSNSTAGGNALLYGGSGPTTLVAGAGNDYMFGGGSGSSYMYQPISGNYAANGSATLQFGPQQMTTFVDGTGNDYMLGGPGPNVYAFKVNAAGARSTTIANFNITTDQLQVSANLDGNGITSASQLLAGATVSNGNTLVHLSPNDNITLLGISTPSSLAHSILVS